MGTFFPFEAASVSYRAIEPPALCLTWHREEWWECLAKRRHTDAEMGEWIMMPMTAKVSFQSRKGFQPLTYAISVGNGLGSVSGKMIWGSLFLLLWKFILMVYWYQSCVLAIGIKTILNPVPFLNMLTGEKASKSHCLRNISCAVSFLLLWMFFSRTETLFYAPFYLQEQRQEDNNIFLRSHF